jgi:hypothetical protein
MSLDGPRAAPVAVRSGGPSHEAPAGRWRRARCRYQTLIGPLAGTYFSAFVEPSNRVVGDV